MPFKKLFSALFLWSFSFFISLAFLIPSTGWCLGMDDFEMAHTLSAGAGIASPSMTSALFENPAGLFTNQQTKFLGEAAWTNSNLNPLGLGGLFFLGNGFVGGGLGIQTFNGQGDNAGSLTVFDFGIGAEVSGLNLAFGVTGAYFLSQNGGVTSQPGNEKNSGVNIGAIFNPRGSTRVGVTAFQVLNNVDAVGVGIAADASSWATFALDGAANTKMNGKVIKPGMEIHLMDFQFAVGYGISLDSYSSAWIPDNTSFGVGIRFSSTIHLQAYYNQLALYYLGLTVKM